MPLEPNLAAPPPLFARYFLATRPAFLSVTFAAVALGLAGALASGVTLQATAALASLLFALLAHAGVNVLNDYYDAKSGADAANTERLYPYTGGSRFIQNGVLSLRATGLLGYALLAIVVVAGLWLTAQVGAGLIGIGLAGLFVGWAYSAPPLQLMSRGWGEFAVAAGWLLVVVGSDYVQRRDFSFVPIACGTGYALLVASLLYINQFPDRRGDAAASKGTLIVRLGPARARWGYVLLIVASYAWLIGMIATDRLPLWSAVAGAAAPLHFAAARELLRHAGQPHLLATAIRLTIGGALAYGVLLAGALIFSGGISGVSS